MRIGIIGAGAAGLTASWLLNEHHDITLFEKTGRIGGHAHTVEVDMDGSVVNVESGFEFFSDAMFPTFVQMLRVLGLELRRYPLTATIYTTDHRQNTLLPPFREGRIIWSGFRPTPLSHLIRLQRTLSIAERVASTPDTTLTVEQFFDPSLLHRHLRMSFSGPFFLHNGALSRTNSKRFRRITL